MKKILVPTDFSPNANKAMYYAFEIALAAKALVILIHVNNEVNSPFTSKSPLELKYNLPYDEAVQLELDLIKKTVKETGKIEIHTKVYAGHVVPSIIQAANENHADMIVMGTVGEAGFTEKLMGSITASVIGKSITPVLAVPLLSEWSIPKHILVLVNNFDERPAISNPAFQLANLFIAKVTLSILMEKDTSFPEDKVERSRLLHIYEEELKQNYCNTIVEPEILDGLNFFERLDTYIDENFVDILVMLTHKRNFIERIFNPSVTQKMTYHTNIPLLAVPIQ